VNKIEVIVNLLLGLLIILGGILLTAFALLAQAWLLIPFYLLTMIGGMWLMIIGAKSFGKSKEREIQKRFCSQCGSQTNWIGQYWCDHCRRYD
jgi:hypothetical protein